MIDKAIPITEIPSIVLESIQQSLSNYTVGFSIITGNGNDEDIELLGSGTLVKVNKIHAILTAHHVLEILPKEGRLSLIISKQIGRSTIDVQGLHYLKIARGRVDSEGPDLAVIIRSPSIASTLSARKSFYILDRHKDKALNNPPPRQNGVWCNIGFIAERTIEEPGRQDYSKIKRFCMQGGMGGPNELPVLRDGFDYISMPVTYGIKLEIPLSFGGMSGGGLWQIQLLTDDTLGIKAGEFLLSGVVFYQEALINDRRNIICHGRTSVYEIAYDAIKNSNSLQTFQQ